MVIASIVITGPSQPIPATAQNAIYDARRQLERVLQDLAITIELNILWNSEIPLKFGDGK